MASSRRHLHSHLGSRLTRIIRILGAVALVSAAIGAAPTAALASTCPPASAGGRVIGVITVGDVQVPLVNMDFPRSRILQPPATNQAAGLSDAHAPLDAEMGTSVISWHVQYGARCPGSLNPILKLPVGGTFTVTDARTPDKPQVYEISKKFATPRGLYLPSWFSQSGPHRLALFTCADRAGREFRKTVAIFAVPRVESAAAAQSTA